MGAEYVNLKGKTKRQQRTMGCEEEGSSSNRPELAAFVLALRGTPVEAPIPSLFVRQPSAAEGCEKMGRRRRKSNISRSTGSRHFARALKENNSRSSDVSSLD